MNGPRGTTRRLPALAGIVAALSIAFGAAPAHGQPEGVHTVWDHVWSNFHVVWSPGFWTVNGHVVCTTFPGGIRTGAPGDPQHAWDHVNCPDWPNDWHWTAQFIWNGAPAEIDVWFENFGADEVVIIEMYCSNQVPNYTLQVDIGNDVYAIPQVGHVAPWSGYPGNLPPGFSPTGTTRGNMDMAPTGACCPPSGTCVETTATGCAALAGTYQGDGTLCTLTICPPPIIHTVWDHVWSNFHVVWSPGFWTVNGALVCTTFPGGIRTGGPGDPLHAWDHVDCPAWPNDWHWFAQFIWNGTPVIVDVWFENFSAGETLITEIYCSTVTPNYTLDIDVGNDLYTIPEIPYTASWSGYPGNLPPDFTPTGSVRGNMDMAPTGACCLTSGTCVETTATGCASLAGSYGGDGSTCVQSFLVTAGLAIPDNNPAGVSSSVVLPDLGSIGDLNVSLDIDHTWVGDLKVTLTAPNGTTVTLIDRPGVPPAVFGCSADNYQNIVLDDEGAGGAIEAQCVLDLTSPPSYTPNDPLSAFDGRPTAGTWTLTVSDLAGADLGTLNSWCLEVVPVCPPPIVHTVWDHVWSNFHVVWSPGFWTVNGMVVCTTFPGGIRTGGFGDPQHAWDHVDCPAWPNDWHWFANFIWNDSTARVSVWFENFGDGDLLYTEIYCSTVTPNYTLDIDVGNDVYAIPEIPYTASWSGYPGNLPGDFSATGASRGNMDVVQPSNLARARSKVVETIGQVQETIDQLQQSIDQINTAQALANLCGLCAAQAQAELQRAEMELAGANQQLDEVIVQLQDVINQLDQAIQLLQQGAPPSAIIPLLDRAIAKLDRAISKLQRAIEKLNTARAQIGLADALLAACGPCAAQAQAEIQRTLSKLDRAIAKLDRAIQKLTDAIPQIQREIDNLQCPKDLTGDNSVGFADLTILLNSWGPCTGCAADFDNNGVVGFADLTNLLNDWGPCP